MMSGSVSLKVQLISVELLITMLALCGPIAGSIANPAQSYDVSTEYEEKQDTDRGVLGIKFSIGTDFSRKTHVTVINIIKGGPAEAAGLQKGDRIIALNDTSVAALKRKQISHLMHGDPGSILKITVERDYGPKVLNLVRGKLTQLPDKDFQTRILKQSKTQEIDFVINTLCERAKREYPDIVKAVMNDEYSTAASALEFVTDSKPKTNTLILYGLVLFKLGKRTDALEILQRIHSPIDDDKTRELVRNLIADQSENKN